MLGVIAGVVGAICALPFGIIGFTLFSVPYCLARGRFAAKISFAGLLAAGVAAVLVGGILLLMVILPLMRK